MHVAPHWAYGLSAVPGPPADLTSGNSAGKASSAVPLRKAGCNTGTSIGSSSGRKCALDVDERRRKVLELARTIGFVKVSDIATDFGISQETARRDLMALGSRGLVRRTHGFAYPVDSAAFETTLAFRATVHVPEKARIAMAAVNLLDDAETVFIDEGFTPQLIARSLPKDRPLTVITVSLEVAKTLAVVAKTTVLLLGGRVRGGTMATVGPWVSRMLSGCVIDLAYISASGISRCYGLTTPVPMVGEVKSQVVRAARRRVFVGAHAKFGAVSFCRFAEVSDLDVIVTDARLQAAEAHRFKQLGPHVLRV